MFANKGNDMFRTQTLLLLFYVFQCAMCCGGTAASMCCSACPNCTNSSSSRFMYAFMLLVGTILGAIALSPGLQETLKKMPFCINSTSTYSAGALSTFSGGTLQADCDFALGYMAVYRLCFGLACFFALMALIMIGVKSSRDPRSSIQNNFWPLKFLICFGAAIGAIFIPDGSFGPSMMWVGLIGGLVFILIQLVIIVDFAHTLAENWIGESFKSLSNESLNIISFQRAPKTVAGIITYWLGSLCWATSYR